MPRTQGLQRVQRMWEEQEEEEEEEGGCCYRSLRLLMARAYREAVCKKATLNAAEEEAPRE
jgi:hypothetical protein